ncbi:hypothetical protein PH210_05760 [Paenibacillus sp. BSR1-1]|uniref:hypothetical protein n=1 Tax=Paenibacillus sp. BSR1-1 TaxID=3020845 RepID=UPI0025B0680D|nr:hypothetical protein [Paenibacillus sp. BSR1-1]MDN3015714.1 hypothetical protein [Paenibacillus sp. BSR1-1]
MKLSDRFFKNRVKPIVITQLILTIPMIIIVFLIFTSNTVNFFYNEVTGIILAISMFLNGIEQYILKKNRVSIAFFVLTLFIILVVIQTFYVASLKR